MDKSTLASAPEPPPSPPAPSAPVAHPPHSSTAESSSRTAPFEVARYLEGRAPPARLSDSGRRANMAAIAAQGSQRWMPDLAERGIPLRTWDIPKAIIRQVPAGENIDHDAGALAARRGDMTTMSSAPGGFADEDEGSAQGAMQAGRADEHRLEGTTSTEERSGANSEIEGDKVEWERR
ncbi:hypothetical protein JCM10450v2_001061 [Rhodotorula kratochvilovae]